MVNETSDGYHVRRREFLNEDLDLPAYIIAIVEDTRAIPDDDPKLRWNDGEIALDLADCSRRISFYFNMYDAEERAKSLRKISLIAEVVNAVRAAMVLEVASRNARPKSPATEANAGEVLEAVKKEPALTEDRREQVFTSHFVTLGL
jgi:hypothetical protein